MFTRPPFAPAVPLKFVRMKKMYQSRLWPRGRHWYRWMLQPAQFAVPPR